MKNLGAGLLKHSNSSFIGKNLVVDKRICRKTFENSRKTFQNSRKTFHYSNS